MIASKLHIAEIEMHGTDPFLILVLLTSDKRDTSNSLLDLFKVAITNLARKQEVLDISR